MSFILKMKQNKIYPPFSDADLQLLASIQKLEINKKTLNQSEILLWLIQNKVYPYWLRKLLKNQRIEITFPLWTFHKRMGQSVTQLPDGTKVYIGGEYEDFYDPDFKIYNDIVIEKPNGKIDLWNYPEAQFPPTDFHTAHYDEQTHSIFLIGNLGYDAQENLTQVLCLDVNSLEMQQLETYGSQPIWLNSHHIKMINDDMVELFQGNIFKDGQLFPNLYTWHFNLRTQQWSLPKQIIYDHWMVHAEDYQNLLLDECSSLILYEYMKWKNEFEKTRENVLKDYGYLPDYSIYPKLFLPFDDAQLIEDECIWNKYICVSQGHLFWYFKNDDRVQVFFANSISITFQKMIIDDLKSKLKQISRHDIVAEKVM